MDKMLDILLWSVVGIAVFILFAIIIIGHSTNFRFLSSVVTDQTLLATNIQYLGSKLS